MLKFQHKKYPLFKRINHFCIARVRFHTALADLLQCHLCVNILSNFDFFYNRKFTGVPCRMLQTVQFFHRLYFLYFIFKCTHFCLDVFLCTPIIRKRNISIRRLFHDPEFHCLPPDVNINNINSAYNSVKFIRDN